MSSFTQHLADSDPDISHLIDQELHRQNTSVELIASENYTSRAVMEAQSSILTNKYAEGYPGKRYYGGCGVVDQVETLAIERAKTLFGADYANVQPHSGSQANQAVFQALLKPGDCILGMSLQAGGHLTHGAKVNLSGMNYQAIPYHLNASHDIDYDEVATLAEKHRPQMIIAGFSCFSGIVDWQRFREISDHVGAILLIDMAHVAGLVATGLYPSPLPHADVVTTTVHKTLRGPRGGLILAKANEKIARKINSAIFPGIQGGPLMHTIAAKAVCFKEAMSTPFKKYQQNVLTHAQAMANRFIEKGYPVISGGTCNHQLSLDLRSTGFSGKQAEAALGQANISVNRNTIPEEQRSPMETSGIRLGTPAITTRGFDQEEILQITDHMAELLADITNTKRIASIKQAIIALCQRHPIYGQV